MDNILTKIVDIDKLTISFMDFESILTYALLSKKSNEIIKKNAEYNLFLETKKKYPEIYKYVFTDWALKNENKKAMIFTKNHPPKKKVLPNELIQAGLPTDLTIMVKEKIIGVCIDVHKCVLYPYLNHLEILDKKHIEIRVSDKNIAIDFILSYYDTGVCTDFVTEWENRSVSTICCHALGIAYSYSDIEDL